MIVTSTIAGTLVSSYVPSARIVAAISLSTAFLAPGHVDRAVQLADPAHDDLPGVGR